MARAWYHHQGDHSTSTINLNHTFSRIIWFKDISSSHNWKKSITFRFHKLMIMVVWSWTLLKFSSVQKGIAK